MSSIADAIQDKCLAFSDRIIKLNDYLLKEVANKKPPYKMVKGKRVYEKTMLLNVKNTDKKKDTAEDVLKSREVGQN